MAKIEPVSWEAKLTALRWSPLDRPTERHIAAFETQIGSSLPADYREFLLQRGAGSVHALTGIVNKQEETGFYLRLKTLADSLIVPVAEIPEIPSLIRIATGVEGGKVYLFLKDHPHIPIKVGAVYYREASANWVKELSDQVWEFEFIADSFTAFLGCCIPNPWSD
jgi:SMI1-KNR4 cell-wall